MGEEGADDGTATDQKVEQGTSEPGLREFTSEFLQELYNLDRGVPGTWIALFKRPELVVKDYFGRGSRFMNPFRYTLFVGSVVTLLASLFDYGEVFRSTLDSSSMEGMESLPESFLNYMEIVMRIGVLMTTKYLALTYIFLMSPTYALSSYLFFKKDGSSYARHFILNLYGGAQVATFSLLSMPIAALTENYALVGWIFIPLFSAYIMWVYYRNFGGSGWKGWSRILFSVLVGYVIMLIATMIFQNSLAAILFFW